MKKLIVFIVISLCISIFKFNYLVLGAAANDRVNTIEAADTAATIDLWKGLENDPSGVQPGKISLITGEYLIKDGYYSQSGPSSNLSWPGTGVAFINYLDVSTVTFDTTNDVYEITVDLSSKDIYQIRNGAGNLGYWIGLHIPFPNEKIDGTSITLSDTAQSSNAGGSGSEQDPYVFNGNHRDLLDKGERFDVYLPSSIGSFYLTINWILTNSTIYPEKFYVTVTDSNNKFAITQDGLDALEVVDKIKALPYPENVTIANHQAEIEAVKTAYEALNSNSKTLLWKEISEKYQDVLAKLNSLLNPTPPTHNPSTPSPEPDVEEIPKEEIEMEKEIKDATKDNPIEINLSDTEINSDTQTRTFDVRNWFNSNANYRILSIRSSDSRILKVASTTAITTAPGVSTNLELVGNGAVDITIRFEDATGREATIVIPVVVSGVEDLSQLPDTGLSVNNNILFIGSILVLGCATLLKKKEE